MLYRLFIKRYLLGFSRGSVVRTLSLISVTGIGLGVMAMVVIISIMAGFDEAIQSRLLGVESHIEVLDDSPELEKQIAMRLPESSLVEKFARQDVLLRTVDGLYSGAVANGVTPESLSRLAKKVKAQMEVVDTPTGMKVMNKGETTDSGFTLAPKEIAVGYDLARSLGILEGDTVTLIAPESLLLPQGELPIYEKARVKALVKTSVQDLDRTQVYYDYVSGLKKLQESASLVKGYEIRLKNPNEVRRWVRALKEVSQDKIRTWEEMNSALFYSLKMEKLLMTVFLALTIFISSFSVVAVLVLLVTEKRHDIGVLKALGATEGKIKRIFLRLGVVLGASGIVGGLILGLLACYFIDRYPIFELPEIYQDTTIPVKVEFAGIVLVMVLGSVLIFFGSWLPVGRVSQLNPVDSLKRSK